jgi:hypothetical protein
VRSQWQWPEQAPNESFEVFAPGATQWLLVHGSGHLSGARAEAEILDQLETDTLSSNSWQFLAVPFQDTVTTRNNPRWEGKIGLNVTTGAQAVQICFTGAVVSEWKELKLFYADSALPGASGEQPRTEITAHRETAGLPFLQTLPSDNKARESFLLSSAPCRVHRVQDGRVDSVLPALTPQPDKTSLWEDHTLYVMYLVQGLPEWTDVSAPIKSANR